jgi:hypothetical protein
MQLFFFLILSKSEPWVLQLEKTRSVIELIHF